MVEDRIKTIYEKGFDMTRDSSTVEYGKMKVGLKTLQDATIDLGILKDNKYRNRRNSIDISKSRIVQAMADQDLPALRELSEFFYRTNGIYQRVCNYFATMYRYDWYVVPEIYDEKVKEEKVVQDFTKILNYLDNSYIKKVCGEIALNVIKYGAYYGYLVPSADGITLQELPIRYCRVRYNVGNLPAVEFDMRFFDEQFTDINYRMRVLKMFPEEFAKGYVLYKQGKLQPDYQGDIGR